MEPMAKMLVVMDSEQDDPLAKQLEWTPVSASTASFRTTRLCDLGADGLVYRPTITSLLFLGGISFAMTAVGIICILASRTQEPEIAWIGIPFFAIGALLGYLLVRSFTRAPFFNACARRLERSGGPGESAVAARSDAVPFEAMRALQILTYFNRGDTDTNGYDVTQLNVVLHDGRRVHVTSSPDSGSLEAEAAMIARLVGVEVWRRP